MLRQCHAYVYGGSRVPGSLRSPSENELVVDVAEVGAPKAKKVRRLWLRNAKQFLILWLITCLLCMCHDNFISDEIKDGQSLVIVYVIAK